jgi:hypothetical protein
MRLFAKLNPYVFIISFCIGIFIVYLSEPPQKIIIQHPRPNDDKTIYRDDSNNCYKYKTIEVKCPADKSLILDHPLEIK